MYTAVYVLCAVIIKGCIVSGRQHCHVVVRLATQCPTYSRSVLRQGIDKINV